MQPRKGTWRRSWRRLPLTEPVTPAERRAAFAAPACAPCGRTDVTGLAPAGSSTDGGGDGGSDTSLDENPWADMVEPAAGPSEEDYAEALRQARALVFRRCLDGWGECYACSLKGKRSRWGQPGASGREHYDTRVHQAAEA